MASLSTHVRRQDGGSTSDPATSRVQAGRAPAQNGAIGSDAGMPLVIYIFALTAFALGLAEFVPIGLTDVRGLIAISIALFSDRAPKQILAVDALGVFRALGLEQHLTPQRSNGVRAMIERMRADAAAA